MLLSRITNNVDANKIGDIPLGKHVYSIAERQMMLFSQSECA